MLFYITLILAIIGLVISDPYLTSLDPNMTQGILVIPFIIYSFSRFKINFHDPFIKNITPYCLIVWCLWI